jgi:ribonuclease MRP protein subunit RMP1
MDQDVYPSLEAVEKLKLELSLLQILHHRNKNQHHLQQFFKHLAILKRTLARLLELGNSEYILERLRTVTIPKAWEEFSRVVARGEFVNLGLVLCACVGRIAFCLGGIVGADAMMAAVEVAATITEETEELGEVVMREVFVKEMGEMGDIGNIGNICKDRVPVMPSPLTSSFGVTEDIQLRTSMNICVSRVEERGLGDIEASSRKKQKRKRKDDIDELFARLE